MLCGKPYIKLIRINKPFYFFANFYAAVTNGPAKYAQLIRRLDKKNHRLFVVTEDAEEPLPERVIKLPPRPRWLKTTFLTQIYRNRVFYRFVKERKLPPDTPLIFNNIISGNTCAVKLPNPVIGFINDDNNLPDSATGKGLLKSRNKTLLRGLEKKAAHNADLVVVNSEYLRRRIHQAYGISLEKLPVLYKGLKIIDNPPPVRPIIPGQPLKIVFVKSDFVRGGLTDLIQALFLLPKEIKTELTVIGVTLAQFLRKTDYNQTRLPANIKWEGSQPQAVVHRHLAQCHIFCVPARREALGVANMEAMMYRARVIATDAGGIPEVTDGGHNCFEVPVQSPEKIAVALQKLYAEPLSETEARAERGLTYIRENFSEEKAYARLLEIVDSLKDV